MISKLDDGIGKVVEAIKEKGMMGETIILFYSDNGAPTRGLFNNFGSNHPLKGVSSNFFLNLFIKLCEIHSKRILHGKVRYAISVYSTAR